jgi:alanyl-tRNA synthetase
MTTRLYYTDAYVTEFSARIIERAEDGRRIYLDRTAFYPTSGGQPFDIGVLGGSAVTDVIDEGDRIAHVLAAPLDAHETAAGKIDWARRYDHMQQHTGQHLLSAVLADAFGFNTISVHFGADIATLDLDTPALAPEQVVEAEARANAIVFENRPILVTFEDAATASGLRKPTDREGTLRVVSIDGVDRSACGGTHVRATGEIGPVLVRGASKIRQSTRLEFICGGRAVRRARADFEALSRIAQALSASFDDVPSLIAAQTEQLRDASSARRKLETELATFRARALYDSADPNDAGVRTVVVRQASGSPDESRALALALAELPRCVCIVASLDPPAVLLAASADSEVNAGAVLKAALTAAGGRGGGSPRLAQGSLPSANLVDDVIRALSSAR